MALAGCVFVELFMLKRSALPRALSVLCAARDTMFIGIGVGVLALLVIVCFVIYVYRSVNKSSPKLIWEGRVALAQLRMQQSPLGRPTFTPKTAQSPSTITTTI